MNDSINPGRDFIMTSFTIGDTIMINPTEENEESDHIDFVIQSFTVDGPCIHILAMGELQGEKGLVRITIPNNSL